MNTSCFLRPLNLGLAAALLLTIRPVSSWAQAAPAANLLRGGDMSRSTTVVNKWGGVDSTDTLKGLVDESRVVTSSGAVDTVPFPVSPSIGDLNGDKLLDIILADSKGHFWFFANSGTAKEAKFTRGEVIPIFLTGPSSFQGMMIIGGCDKIHVIDFDGDGLLDIIAGDALGYIAMFKNVGASNAPKFNNPMDPESIAFKLNSRNLLRGNFFSPFVYDWNADGKYDLIWGDGTYSANSIYLALNGGSNSAPKFTEETQAKIIPGLGKEHLTPQVIDWNGDGKPDILTGERDGSVSIYINNSSSKDKPTFEPPQPVLVGKTSKLGSLSVPVPFDINSDGLPDLFFGRTSSCVELSLNKGAPKAPLFDAPLPVKGVQTYPKYQAPSYWDLQPPQRSTYEIMRIVSSDRTEPLTFEPDFVPSPGTPEAATNPKVSQALKVEFVPSNNIFFPGILPLLKDAKYRIAWQGILTLKPNVRYELSFYCRGSFASGASQLTGRETYFPPDKKEESITEIYNFSDTFPLGSAWNQVRHVINLKKKEIPDDKPVSLQLAFELEGKGNFYMDDVVFKQAD